MAARAKKAGPLAEYNAKRDFARTAEPEGKVAGKATGPLRFLVQKHAATRLHYDFRLEWEGVLLSWAVTRGPSLDPADKRLAVRTEDHPLSYGDFEGTIPKGEYGGGTVMMWDEGHWQPEGDIDAGLAEGKLKFSLAGRRMKGRWTLVRMRRKEGESRDNWLLIKERDAIAEEGGKLLTDRHTTSVTTGRTMKQIAAGAPDRPARDERGSRPRFRKPQLATLVDEAPEGEDWVHETKFDGYRCLASIGKGGARLFTRAGNDWTDKFGGLPAAFDGLPCTSALLDGEVMPARVSGSAFSSLQRALSRGEALVFYAFDILSLDGKDMTGESQEDRRAALEALLAGIEPEGPLRLSDQITGMGPQVFAAACKAGAEGIISKRLDAPYRGQRTRAWRKVKCTRRQEFVIGGLSESDKRGRPFSSILLGEYGPDGLRYRGRVGTGFRAADFEAIMAGARVRKTSPFDSVPGAAQRGVTWLSPQMVAEVDFAEFTEDGHIRHGAFIGLRADKPAKEVTIEMAEHPVENAGTSEEGDRVAGIRISSPDRAVYPGVLLRKIDVARYCEAAGDRLVEIAGHRPLSLLRCPEGLSGECFFQKHAGKGFPEELRRVPIRESDGGEEDYLYATTTAAFVSAAQMGSLEFHVWGARIDRLERPDRMVFDLDPDEGLAWSEVRALAFDLRDRLGDLGLASVPVVTGGKGVHVCVLLRRTQGWDSVKLFSQGVARAMAQDEPARVTAKLSKAARKGRIFIDYLRNERGATAIAPYSLRARKGAPVAVPVRWDELEQLEAANTFGVEAALERLGGDCPYLEALGDLQTLGKAAVAGLEAWLEAGGDGRA